MSEFENLDWSPKDPEDIRASRLMEVRAQLAVRENTYADPEVIVDILEQLDELEGGGIVGVFVPDAEGESG